MILDDIAEKTRERVAREKNEVSLEKMKSKAIAMGKVNPFAFENAIRSTGMHFICEVKKASPSKGIIAQDFPYRQIAKEYEAAGADCISVLTEPDFFLGSNSYLTEIREEVNIPLLRKDFIIDEYQIYQAKVIGADCILLIAALLPEDTIRSYLRISDSLGMSTLVEAHDQSEIEAASKAGARMIGINNRNLKTFDVNIGNSIDMRSFVDKEIIFVAESGISTREDVEVFEKANVNAVLVGETLMRSMDKGKKLKELRGNC